MKKYIIVLFLAGVLLVPGFSFAQITGDVNPDQTSSCASITHNLQYRSRDINTSGDVSTLQDFLQSQGYLNSEPTGYFGLLTQIAVKSFQTKVGILNSGYVGPITRAKISSVSGCSGVTPIICPAITQPAPNFCPNGKIEPVIGVNNCTTSYKCTTSSTGPVISSVSGSQTLNVNQMGTWTINASSSNGGNLTYSVNWGDVYSTDILKGNSLIQPQSQTATFTHTYSQIGTYTPVFTVTSENTIRCITTPCPGNGGSAQTSLTVNVVGVAVPTNNNPVIGSFVVPSNVNTGQSVSFVFNATDADNDNLIWSTDWGEGTAVSMICPMGNINLQEKKNWTYNANHVWNKAGTYNAKVTVSDCKGGINSSNFTVTVGGTTPIPSLSIGDVNGDGSITCTDNQMILDAVVGNKTLTVDQKSRADVDGNGSVQAYDSSLLMQRYGLTCGATTPSTPACPQIFVSCSAGTAPESYTGADGCNTFRCVKPVSTLLGDVNGDGSITCTDVNMILNAAVNGNLTTDQKSRADIDGNGSVSSYDASLLMQRNGLSCGTVPPITTPTTTTTPSINVLSPNGGETYKAGDMITVKWNSPNISTDNQKVVIVLNNTGNTIYFDGYELTGPDGTPNDGVESFTLSKNLAPGQYKVKILLKYNYDILDSSDNYFTVTSPTPTPITTPSNPINLPVVSSGTVTIYNISGPQTLNVNQTGTWTINASSSSGATLTYIVDWGDAGAQCPTDTSCLILPSSTTQSTAIFTHSYFAAGTYNLTFMAVGSNNSGSPKINLTVKINSTSGTTASKNSIFSSLTANALDAFGSATNNDEKNSQTNINTNVEASSCSEFTKILSKGINDSEVKCLQKLLNEKGFKIEGVEVGQETEYFGYATQMALKKFQAGNGLTVDGLLGPATSKALLK